MNPPTATLDRATNEAPPAAVGRGARRPRSRSSLVTLVAVVGGAAWRIGYLLAVKWHQPLLYNDSIYYSEQAIQPSHGLWFREPMFAQGNPGAEHGPLTSLLMMPVSWVHHPVPYQRLVTVLCGIATIVVVAAVARRLAGPRAGAIAAVLAAVYPNLWMNDGLVMSESVSTLCVALALLALVQVSRRPSRAGLVACGLALGLATLARSELILLLLLGAGLVWWAERSRRGLLRAGAVLAIGLAVVSPWVTWNLVRFDRPVLLSTNDGTTLIGANCDTSYSGSNIGGWTYGCVVSDDPAGTGTEEPSVRSDRRRHIGLDYARAHVGHLPTVVAARIGRTLDLWGLGELHSTDVGDERSGWASWLGIGAFWALAPLAAVGLVRTSPAGRRALLAPCLCVLVTSVAFYGAHRIRSSAEPTVVIAAAVALTSGSVRLRRRIPSAAT